MAYCDYCGFEIGKECDCPTPMPRPEKPLHRKPDDPVLYCDNCTKPIPDDAVFCIVQDNISDWFCTARCQKEWAQLMAGQAVITAQCPKCKAKSQLTLTATGSRIHITCGNCRQWWSIGEIEHMPYFFGGPKASNGPNETAAPEP